MPRPDWLEGPRSDWLEGPHPDWLEGTRPDWSILEATLTAHWCFLEPRSSGLSPACKWSHILDTFWFSSMGLGV